MVEMKESDKLNDEFQAQSNEIDKLATFILTEFPNEPGSTGEIESAVDVAIRLLSKSKEITVTTDDDELIASISISEKNAIVKEGYKVSGYDND